MRPFLPRTLNQSLKPTTTTTTTTLKHHLAKMSTQDLQIEAQNPPTHPSVTLSPTQNTLVGSVLDLFAGRPSLAKLGLWTDDATFEDPIAHAQGRKEYEAQWYGLQTAFSELERLQCEVTSAGNPIEMDLKMRYVVKGVGMEKVMASKVRITTTGEGEGMRISKVQDMWDGKLPEGAIADAFRRLNATTMPKVVGVPKNAEEDKQRGN